MRVQEVVGRVPVQLDPLLRKCIDATRVRGIQFKWRRFKKELAHLCPEAQDGICQTLDELCADPVPPEARLVGHGTGLFSVATVGGHLLYWVKLNLAANALHIVPVAVVRAASITYH